MALIEEWKKICGRIEDPRIARNKKHPLMSVLFVILCSCLAGIDNWVGMEGLLKKSLGKP
ncbi:MAG: transposase family protein [Chlamydiota bacterium]